MTKPSAETNDPLPPLLKRTLAFCRWSSQGVVASKPYFFLQLRGGRRVEEPHALVGFCQTGSEQNRNHERGETS